MWQYLRCLWVRVKQIGTIRNKMWVMLNFVFMLILHVHAHLLNLHIKENVMRNSLQSDNQLKCLQAKLKPLLKLWSYNQNWLNEIWKFLTVNASRLTCIPLHIYIYVLNCMLTFMQILRWINYWRFLFKSKGHIRKPYM